MRRTLLSSKREVLDCSIPSLKHTWKPLETQSAYPQPNTSAELNLPHEGTSRRNKRSCPVQVLFYIFVAGLAPPQKDPMFLRGLIDEREAWNA